MSNVTVRLDHRGIEQLLKSAAMANAVAARAEEIAGQVRAQRSDADVVVDRYETDRAAASVTVRDVRAQAWQARDGLLTRAAAGAGLEVTERGG